MPRCAILSVLVAPAGTVTASGAAGCNPAFQSNRVVKSPAIRPGKTAVLRPAEVIRLRPGLVKALPSGRRASDRGFVIPAVSGRAP